MLPNAVYDGVVNGIRLGEERTPDGEKGADFGGLENTRPVDYKIRCPCHKPEGDRHQSDL